MAPKGFDECRRQGGKIKSVSVGKGKYMHICFLNGKSYKGEVKERKDKGHSSPVAAAIQQRMGKK
jgi:hypothetical protein